MSVRLRLTLSYAALVLIAGILLLGSVWLFLLRYVPDEPIAVPQGFVPNRSDLAAAFMPAAAASLLGLLLLGAGGGWWLAGRMLVPLDRITRTTRAVAAGSLERRIGMSDRHDEYSELADAFDTMLDRLETARDEQRRFAANASHELRTPLATIGAMVAVARNDPDRDVNEVLRRVASANGRAVDLVEALLLLARAERGDIAREPMDLLLAIEESIEALLPRAEASGIAVALHGHPTPVHGSPALLQQLATNLLHNAIVHNVPVNGTATVRLKADGGRARLSIDNTGPVLTDADVAGLIEPFRRGDDRIRIGHHPGGTGLGLAIARSIVLAHDGTLTLRPRLGGGLHVSVELPSAAR